MTKLINKLGSNQTEKAKLIVLTIEAVTATIGGSSLLLDAPKWFVFSVLVIGAISTKIIQYYDWDKKVSE